VSIQRPDADIQTMAIAPSVQGRGVGGLLLDTVIEHSREQGVRHIFLVVREDNVPALALYRRRGFEQISIRHHYYPDSMAAVVMRRTDPGGLS
ncbi:MAG: GNAT family N-acetyltransferase, partial [Candidatus Nanopelagicales bacterium]|nr:GNAT family N-acetyltransferase [Candidatus Nanopelagicales bacterium]